jgi:translocation and assembly module TamB
MTALKWLRRITLALIFLILIVLFFVLTNPGLKAIVYVASKFTPGQLNYQKLDGALIGPIGIEGFTYKNKGTDISVSSLRLNWSLGGLLDKKLVIHGLDIGNVIIITPKQAIKPKKEVKPEKEITPGSLKKSIIGYLNNLKNIKLKPLSLPLSVEINNAHIASIQLGHAANDMTTIIDAVNINGGVSDAKMNLLATAELVKPQKMSIAISLNGSLKHYVASLTVRNNAYDFLMHVVGNQDEAEIVIPKAHVFDGSIQGKLNLTWYPEVNWDINLNIHNVDLQELDQNLPKSISLVLNTKGELKDNDLIFDLNADARADKATLKLIGQHNKLWHIKWNVNVPDLQELYPGATGIIKTQGTLNGELTSPEISGTANGSNIKLGTVSLGSIKGNWQLYFDKTRRSNIIFILNKLEYGDNKLDDIKIGLNGNLLKRSLHAKLSIGKPALVLAAEAHYDGSAIRGKITQFTSKMNKLASWSLKRPAKFVYSSKQAYLEPMCLNVTSGGYACMKAAWEQDKPWDFKLNSKNFNFKELENKFVPSVSFNGKLSINAHAIGVGKEIENASVKAVISPGLLTAHVDNAIINKIVRKSTIDLLINKKVGLKANVLFNFAQHDKLDLKANIPEFTDYSTPLKDKKLKTDIHILVYNFQFVTLFEHTLEVPKGKLVGHFMANGTVGDPHFKGDAQIYIPSFLYTLVNVRAHDLKAYLHVDGKKLTYGLKGYAYNEAPLYFTGDTVLSSPYALTHFYVHTRNAQAIRTKQLNVFVNAELKFLLTHDQLDIDGGITVPKATIAPMDFGSVTLMPVNQITFTGLPKSMVPETSRKKVLHLKLTLGKDVNFKGYGANVNLRGALQLGILPEKGAIGNGQIRIAHGVFNAYGQNLKLGAGSSVSFHNSLVTDPYINARAYKHVTTTMESTGMQLAENILTVGLQIHGALNDLKFTLYSQPPGLSKSDILSYLVLGVAADNNNAASLSVFFNTAAGFARPTSANPEDLTGIKKFLNNTSIKMRNETVLDVIGNPVQDQASFIIGNQLTDNFYVQYSQGLIIPESIFSMRYRLSKHWAIQSQAGSGYNVGVGADILYSFERK